MELFDIHNHISTEQLSRLLRGQLQLLHADPKFAAKLPPLMVWGAPGVGKSSIFREVANELGIGFIDIRLAQREPVDIRGLPVPTDDSIKWLISSDWPRDPSSRGILLFDELTAADRSLQVAAYELILDRRLGELYHIPDGWYICGAGNRVQDSAVATTMSSALANRFMHVELHENVEDWVRWGMRNDIHPAVIAFIRYRPEQLFHQEKENLERGWPTPRSWERVSTMLNAYPSEDQLIEKIIYGLVGNSAGVEFCAFRKLFQTFDDIRNLMLTPSKKIIIPDKAEQKYAICSAMVYYLRHSEDEITRSKLLDGFFRISLKLSSDFASMALMDMIAGVNEKFDSDWANRLFEHPEYKKWAIIHGKMLKSKLNGKKE